MKSDRWKQRITIYSFILWMVGLIAALVILPRQTLSESERRRLADRPVLTLENILDESFMEDFESYLLDHFPFRDGFRRIKAQFAYDVLFQKENNGIYVAEGYAAKLEELNVSGTKKAADKMKAVKEQYFPDQDAYYAIIPDKSCFLAARNGYPSADYDEMLAILRETIPQEDFIYINIMPTLSIDDYYKTDTHWRQEQLLDTALCIGNALGVSSDMSGEITFFYQHAVPEFYGVYYGQSALPLEADTIYYLTNDVIDSASVWNMETGLTNPVYEFGKLEDETSLDKYDIFLGGAAALQVLSSPKAGTDRRLIIFRDSYASSLVPLFLNAYREITLIDLRYISTDKVGEYVDFNGADVLFLYNTLVINNGSMLK